MTSRRSWRCRRLPRPILLDSSRTQATACWLGCVDSVSVKLQKDTNLCAIHAKRVTIMPKDSWETCHIAHAFEVEWVRIRDKSLVLGVSGRGSTDSRTVGYAALKRTSSWPAACEVSAPEERAWKEPAVFARTFSWDFTFAKVT